MSGTGAARLACRGTREHHHRLRSKQERLQQRQAREGQRETESHEGRPAHAETLDQAVERGQSRQKQRHGGRRRERLQEEIKEEDEVEEEEPVSSSADVLAAPAATENHSTSFLALQPTPLNTSRSSYVQGSDSIPEPKVSAAGSTPDARQAEGRGGADASAGREAEEEEEEEEGDDASFEEQLALLAQQVSELSARLAQKEREARERRPEDNFDLTAGAAATRILPPRAEGRSEAELEFRRMRQQQQLRAAAYASRGRGGAGGAPSWMEPQHPTVQSILAGYQETQQLLVEERRRRFALRAEYEKHLALLRKRTQQEKLEIKRRLLTQVDFLIRKYRRLAGEAVAAAKRERARVDEERQAARKLAESACKNFEADLKERTKAALEQYRVLAQQAQKAAQEEKEQLTQKYTALEQSVDEERRQFDALIVQEAEDRVATVREAYGRLKQQLEEERYRYSQLMIEVQKKVELECELYEETLVKGVTQLLLEKGVSDMEEAAVRTYLTTYREEQLGRRSRPTSRSVGPTTWEDQTCLQGPFLSTADQLPLCCVLLSGECVAPLFFFFFHKRERCFISFAGRVFIWKACVHSNVWGVFTVRREVRLGAEGPLRNRRETHELRVDTTNGEATGKEEKEKKRRELAERGRYVASENLASPEEKRKGTSLVNAPVD